MKENNRNSDGAWKTDRSQKRLDRLVNNRRRESWNCNNRNKRRSQRVSKDLLGVEIIVGLEKKKQHRGGPTTVQRSTVYSMETSYEWTLWLVFISVLLLWLLMILFRFYWKTRYLWAPSRSRPKFGRFLWSPRDFFFVSSNGRHRKRFFHRFFNNFWLGEKPRLKKRDAPNWIVAVRAAPWPV